MNKIVCGDSVVECQKLPEASIDIVITSPPYNVDLGANKFNKNPYDLYVDNRQHKDYIAWLEHLFCDILYSKLKDDGRLCINVGDGLNGAVPTHSDIISFMSHRYLPFSTIIWEKGNTSNRAAWGSWLSPSAPSFPRNFEFILLFGKTRKLSDKGVTDLTKEEFIRFANGTWNIRPEAKMKAIGHPAMFPKEIPYRLIKMLTWVGDTICDPFAGAFTTCLVAQELGRKFIGIELSPEYCEIGKKRLGVK